MHTRAAISLCIAFSGAMMSPFLAGVAFAGSTREPVHRASHTTTEHTERHGSHLTHEPRKPPSDSVGFPNAGTLRNGARLSEDTTVRFVPGWVNHYATDELVAMLRRTAHALKDSQHLRLNVGDMSARVGGPIVHHASHQSGRDVDIGFFITDARGHNVTVNEYIGFRGDGHAMAGGTLRFDTPRNWALVRSILSDPVARIEHIFVSTGLRQLLLNYARAHHTSASTLALAQRVMHQPMHANPHANHFHVRIGCPSGDTRCLAGVKPRPRPRRRRRVAAPTHTAHPVRTTGHTTSVQPAHLVHALRAAPTVHTSTASVHPRAQPLRIARH